MTRSTCDASNVDLGGSAVDGNTVITYICITILPDLSALFVIIYFLFLKRRDELEINLPLLMEESRMLTWVEEEMSIPSVLGLSSGESIWILETDTPLQVFIEIWLFGLLTIVIPFTWRLLQLWKYTACNCIFTTREFSFLKH